MSTPATVTIFDRDEPLVTFYKHWDGNVEDFGKEIAEFICDMKIVNGVGRERENIANGMGCFAAQFCSHFKTEVGDFYIVCVKTQAEEYNYHIFQDKIVVTGYDEIIMFEGTWEEFYNYVNNIYED